MNKVRLVLISCVILFSPTIVSAQYASLKICNQGQHSIDVAVAARIQHFITGYYWKESGWYTVRGGDCGVVYSEDFDSAGLITPQSGARIALTMLRSDGWWGADNSKVRDQGDWVRSPGTGKICVKRGQVFEFTRPAGDPAADCNDGSRVPVAFDFMPVSPGEYTLSVNWEGEWSFLPISPPKDAIPKPFGKGTINASFMGKKIVAWSVGPDQRWYYEDGTLVQTFLQEPFRLTGDQASSLFDPTIKQISQSGLSSFLNNFAKLFREVQAELKTHNTSGEINSANFLETDPSRLCIDTIDDRHRTACANFFALDFAKSKVDGPDSDGAYSVWLECKDNEPCFIKGLPWDGSDPTRKVDYFSGGPQQVVLSETAVVFITTQQSGRNLLSELAQAANLFGKYTLPPHVKSVDLHGIPSIH